MCLEFSFHDSSHFTAFSLSPHSSVFCCKQRGKNYKFQKLHYPLEQDYGLKKISQVQKINIQVFMFWQGPHLAKYAPKGIYKVKKMVTFLFLLFLATVISFCRTVACNFLHLCTSTCQVSLCLYKNQTLST